MRKCFQQGCFGLLVFLCSVTFYGQAAPFEKYKFEDGGYILVGVFEHHHDHPLQKKIGEFYTDDISVLNAVKKAWVFKKPQHQYACGYHYYIVLLKNNAAQDSFSINLDCNEFVTDNGLVYFDRKKLEMFAGRFKTLHEETREFANVTQARQFLESERKTASFVYVWPPRWIKYDGEFQFRVKCPVDLGQDCYFSKTSGTLLARLRHEIEEKYPGEPFELASSGGMSGGEAFIKIRCNKSLEEKFDLYDRWERTIFGKWEPYSPSLTWYRRAP